MISSAFDNRLLLRKRNAASHSLKDAGSFFVNLAIVYTSAAIIGEVLEAPLFSCRHILDYLDK